MFIETNTSINFNSCSVTRSGICSNRRTNIIELACKYQLVFVIHEIVIDIQNQVAFSQTPARLDIIQCFILWLLARDRLNKITAYGLTVTDTVRPVNLLTGSNRISQPNFGVKEIIVHVKINIHTSIFEAFSIIINSSVLQINETKKLISQLQAVLPENIEVCFFPVVEIVSIEGRNGGSHLRPDHFTIVISIVRVECTAQY